MRRHAMAPSAGSTSGIGNSRGLFGRAFATRGASLRNDGSGARARRARRVSSLALTFLAATLFAVLFALPAQAAVKAKLAEVGAPAGATAGKLNTPQGIAVNQTGAGAADPGDFYVADRGNNRISQFTASGTFVRAFGFDVVEAGPDNVTPKSAVQSVNVPSSVTGGIFALAFNGQSTGGSGLGNLTEGTNTVAGLVAARGTGATTINSPTVTGVVTTVGKFIVGQTITGAGLPANTTVINVSGGTLTLSANATATGAAVALSSAGLRPFAVGQTITGAGIPAGTAITAVNAAEGKLTLSANVEVGGSGVEVPLKSGLAFNAKAKESEEATAVGKAGTIEGALKGLSSIGTGNVTASGGPGATAAYTVTFAGALADAPLPLIAADSANLAGGVVAISSTTTGVSPLEVCTAASTCKIGLASTAAGGVNGPMAVAVDQATGSVYVNGNANRRIDVFSASGSFQGAFGVGVRLGDSAPFGLDFCTVGTGCIVGQDSVAAGAIKGNATSRTLTVDSGGNLYVPNPGSQRLDVFSPTLNGSSEVIGAAFVRGIGWDVIPAAGPGNVGTELEVCTVASTCQAGAAGNGNGQFIANSPGSVAVDSSGYIYAVTFRTTGNCEATAICRVQKFNTDGTFKEVFGPASGPCQLTFTSGVALNEEVLAVAVDPTNQHVFLLKKTDATGARICELDSAGNEISVSPGSNLTVATGAPGPGLAVGASERTYMANRGPALYILGPVPPPLAEILPPTGVSSTTATLNGKVTVPAPGGEGFDTKYHFEYSGDNGFHWKSIPGTDASAGSVAGTFPVSQLVTSLQPNLNYLVRLVATTGTSVTTGTAQFTTPGAKPSVEGSEALPVAGTSARLNARVNPNNSPTTYRFEWGPCNTPATCGASPYGNQAPDFEPFAGAGGQPLAVSAGIGGLELSTTYHFRLIATNAGGSSFGPDTTFETVEVEGLNDQGLPSNRRYELVSPADKRPQGSVEVIAPALRAFQAAANGESYAYPIIGGLADSTAGGHVEYLAERGDGGWESTQIAAPSLVPTAAPGGTGRVWPSTPQYLSDDLSCVILETPSPLTGDTPLADVELGVTNLYRRNPDGSHTLISNTVPTNPNLEGTGGDYYSIAGASADCKRVFFSANYDFLPGNPSGLYEWEGGSGAGVLRDAGLRPDGTVPGTNVGQLGFGGVIGIAFELSQVNSISPDGRAFFSATSNQGGDNENVAVFVRKAPGTVVDVSQKQPGGTSENRGARYETASPDGKHVFFVANYGLTSAASNGSASVNCKAASAIIGAGAACDLYDYNVETGGLQDLTATTDPGNPKGAAVEGVVAVDEDGSHVYFAAVGQLVPDKGNTYGQNVSEGAVNIYLASGGALSYVATTPKSDLARGGSQGGAFTGENGNLMRSRATWTAQTTPDGGKLLFTSVGDVTGYESGGAVEAYLYSAGSGAIACVSCRSDGAPSAAGVADAPISAALLNVTNRQLPVPRSLSEDGSRVFFSMRDALAFGASEGKRNLYEWRQGVVHWLTTFEAGKTGFLGASVDGEDAFIVTEAQLDPHDFDFNRDVYDIRVGGGFPPPEPSPIPCDPAADQCQGAPTPAPGASDPASRSVNGPGNPAAKRQPGRKSKGKKYKKAHKRAHHRRAASHNRGGAK